MTAPVDLDALERLLATTGAWTGQDYFDPFGEDRARIALSAAAVNALPALIAELRAARQDAARMDWILHHATSRVGDYGFKITVFVPHDSDNIRTAIDAAIAKGGPT